MERQRYSDIHHHVGGISQRMQTLTLKNLERDGLVCKHVISSVPPHVEYELTKLGASLVPPL
ncbi:MAG TPA: helix-turn-helix domain-containing protein [Paraburkholderia sp.]